MKPQGPSPSIFVLAIGFLKHALVGNTFYCHHMGHHALCVGFLHYSDQKHKNALPPLPRSIYTNKAINVSVRKFALTAQLNPTQFQAEINKKRDRRKPF